MFSITRQQSPHPLRVHFPLSNRSKIAYTLPKKEKAELSDLSDKPLSGLHKAPIRAN